MGGRCANRVTSGRCPACARQAEQWRGSAASRGYDRDWARYSQQFRRDYPLCGMRPNGVAPVMSRCHDEGRITPAKQVDHVVPHRGNPTLFADPTNHQSLCAACGARKSQAGL